MYITGKVEISTLKPVALLSFLWQNDALTWKQDEALLQQMKASLSFQSCCCNFYCTLQSTHVAGAEIILCIAVTVTVVIVWFINLYNLINLHTRSVWETICNARASYASRIFGSKSKSYNPGGIVNDYYYDVQLPINHVVSKTVLRLVAVCITSQKYSKHMLKVCRKFSKKI